MQLENTAKKDYFWALMKHSNSNQSYMKYILLSSSFLFATNILLAQTKIDSNKVELQPVEIKQYFNKQAQIKLTNSSQTISAKTIQSQSPISLTSSLNTVAGIKMEERSPGSYRLAMRGSLIRSPFGIRNTKIYIDEIPLTDAGGNTYLNLLDPNSISSIHVIKGPDGSIFGANSGGVIRLTPNGFHENNNENVSLELTQGSYGLFQENLALSKNIGKKYNFTINQSYLTSDGYRENSSLHRKTIQTTQQWKYASKAKLQAFVLYSDVDYQTPGGLTQEQYNNNPKASRPAAGPNPSAAEQKAAIYNKTLFGGINNTINITKNLKHFITVYGSYTDFENPFITNYEFRTEKNLGLRTFFSYLNNDHDIPFEVQVGLETIKGWNKIDNFDNNKGVVADRQAKDKLNNQQTNIFSRIQVNLTEKWTVEGSLGLNKNSVDFTTLYPIDKATTGNINFKDVWMPRIASSYVLNTNMSLRASISKGYSTPTIAEIRSSDNLINTDLLAESGVNYEIGYKLISTNKKWIIDLSAYDYSMKNGIVRNINESGAEFYTNAGEMKQQGLELSTWTHWDLNNSIIKRINFNSALAYNHYRFGHYQDSGEDFKGNKITSVPDWTLTNTLGILFLKEFELNIYHNHTSKIPLNDANTVFADKYDLLQAKLIKNNLFPKLKGKIDIYFGLDNILNQKYSLGNDINAFGGRYFNAAPLRNYYVGLKFNIAK